MGFLSNVSPSSFNDAIMNNLTGKADSGDHIDMLGTSLVLTGEPMAIATAYFQQKYGIKPFKAPSPAGRTPELDAASAYGLASAAPAIDPETRRESEDLRKRLIAAGLNPAAAASAQSRLLAGALVERVELAEDTLGELRAVKSKYYSRGGDYTVTGQGEAGLKGFLDGLGG